MDGVIGINKEQGYTSFDCIAVLRGILATKKIGHSGTLDPMATGVLVTFMGKATKFVDYMPNEGKVYVAGFKLGVITDTQDITGRILSTRVCNITTRALKNVFALFTGKIMQTPPMYSAVSVGGKKLYTLARQGIEIERNERPITINEINLLSFDGQEGLIEVSCSKGTYIRTLISDIGNELLVGAVMTSLVRTRSGSVELKDCTTISELRTMKIAEISKLVMPISHMYSEVPRIVLDEEQLKIFQNGAILDVDRLKMDKPNAELYGIYTQQNEFLGIGNCINNELIARRW